MELWGVGEGRNGGLLCLVDWKDEIELLGSGVDGDTFSPSWVYPNAATSFHLRAQFLDYTSAIDCWSVLEPWHKRKSTITYWNCSSLKIVKLPGRSDAF